MKIARVSVEKIALCGAVVTMSLGCVWTDQPEHPYCLIMIYLCIAVTVTTTSHIAIR